MYAVVYNAVGTGEQKRAQVGSMHQGRRVLSISGVDPIVITQDLGHALHIPAGAVVKIEQERPAPAKRAAPERRLPVSTAPVYSNGAPVACVYHDSLGATRMVAVGDVIGNGEVIALIRGVGCTALMQDGSAGLQIPSGSIARWIIA